MKPLKFIHITKTAGTTIENLGLKKNIKWGRFHKEYGPCWHRIFPRVREHVKLNYDWFMVVRNPYDRLISEFYCNFDGRKNLKNLDEISNDYFNQYIKDKINIRSPLGDHYTEQYKYLYDNEKIHIQIIHKKIINRQKVK